MMLAVKKFINLKLYFQHSCFKTYIIRTSSSHQSVFNRDRSTFIYKDSRSFNKTFCSKHVTSESWNVLYKYPKIKYMRLFSRLKTYQIIFMACMCYPLYTSYIEDLITKPVFISGLTGCVGTSVAFILFSYFSMRVVGQLAINESENAIRISRLTFYGSRVEDYFNVDDILPWTDMSMDNDIRKVFQRLYLQSEKGRVSTYLYSLKYGRLSNKHLFYGVLGLPSE